jgi:hypothetical protein
MEKIEVELWILNIVKEMVRECTLGNRVAYVSANRIRRLQSLVSLLESCAGLGVEGVVRSLDQRDLSLEVTVNPAIKPSSMLISLISTDSDLSEKTLAKNRGKNI